MESQEATASFWSTWGAEQQGAKLDEALMLQIKLYSQNCCRLGQQNQLLREELNRERACIPHLKEEKQRLLATREEQEGRVKRRYSKRRTWLEKKFSCSYAHCHGKYSSKIALNNHYRKKHPTHIDID